MSEIIVTIIRMLAVELLLPLAKEALKELVKPDNKGVGICPESRKEIEDIMSLSKHSKE